MQDQQLTGKELVQDKPLEGAELEAELARIRSNGATWEAAKRAARQAEQNAAAEKTRRETGERMEVELRAQYRHAWVGGDAEFDHWWKSEGRAHALSEHAKQTVARQQADLRQQYSVF